MYIWFLDSGFYESNPDIKYDKLPIIWWTIAAIDAHTQRIQVRVRQVVLKRRIEEA